MNLRGITVKKDKDKNGENVSHLETSEMVLPHCKIFQQYLST